MSKQSKQRDCLIRGRMEIKATSQKTITVTRCGEWGRVHTIIVEEKTSTTVRTQRFEYEDSQKCIKDFDKKVRDIKREYKNVKSI